VTGSGALRTLGFVSLALVIAGVGVVSVENTRDHLTAMEACDAVSAGDASRALSLTEGRSGSRGAAREVAACRCLALIASEQGPACSDLMAGVLADPASGDWSPDPILSAHLIQTWRDEGRIQDAARLARRAGARHPLDPGLFRLELAARGAIEDESALLAELEARIPPHGDAAARMRATLGQRHLRRGDTHAALAILGNEPPPGAQEGLGLWFDTRGIANAFATDVDATRLTYAAWAHAGGNPAEVNARYAVALSMAGIEDPDIPVIERLRASAENSQGLPDALQETLAIRLILTLVNSGRLDEALATHDRQGQRVALEGLSREELERAAMHRELAATPPGKRRGRLRFDIPIEAGSLSLSPEPDAAPDADFSEFAVSASGVVEAERSAGTSPQRWVLRDADASVVASGTISPWPGREVEVAIRPNLPRRALAPYTPARSAADGRRRVALLLLDCGDWRITQYLRNRGELPVLDTLLREGRSAVLYSDPPLTAAALEAMVWPGRRAGTSFVGVVHRMGVELAGLASIGDNPFQALSWVMPASDDLFSVLGAGNRRAANLLLSHGGIRAGRHGEVTGPGGAKERVPLGNAERDLDAAERKRFPEIAGRLPERDAVHVRTIAAELDVAEELARDTDVHFIALRVEPLDILTHAHFAESVRDGQDDGGGLLFEMYRYIDWRIAAVSDALDQDDVLIVMSDHGIRTSMEHAPEAMWIAHGSDVPTGRTAGQPSFRGVPRAIADLLDVPTLWPDEGVAPWAALDVEPVALPASPAE
jgi:hypothetical protein